MNKNLICQFAKWPQKGRVKTRLAAEVGQDQALLAHIDLVLAVMHTHITHAGAHYQLWLTEDHTRSSPMELANMGQALQRFCQIIDEAEPEIELQVEGDLGFKMHNAFMRYHDRYEKVIVVGSDCPSVSRNTVAEALQKLDDFDLVLSPADDGGFVLIGVRTSSVCELPKTWLSNIEWGTDQVLSQTLNECKKASLSVSLLPELWDVDDLQGYQRWQEEMSN